MADDEGRPPRRRRSDRRPPGRRPPRRHEAAPARTAAFTVLREVSESDAYANIALPRLLRTLGVSGRDAALATELTYGTLRGQGTYDALLGRCVHQPLDTLDAPVLDLLRLGAHQLLRTRIPPHAAVGETVAMARTHVGAGASGLINAVLRRVAEHDWSGWLDLLCQDVDDPDEGLALRHAHPVWIVRVLRQALSATAADDATQLEAALAANNDPPGITLLAHPGLITPQALIADAAAARIGATPGRWSPWAVSLSSGAPGAVPAVAHRIARVQDEGSQLVAGTLTRAPVIAAQPPDDFVRWLDLCAGPGGKTSLLAALAPPGAHVVAVELAPHRAALVRSGLPAQLAHRVDIRVGDGRDDDLLAPPGYDRVLVDAPCTGLGALRRRPEARWRRRPADLATLGPLQRELLRAALRVVRPGGVVGYVTCSPHPAETTAVVGDVLAERTDVRALPAAAAMPAQLPDSASGDFVQLWPHRHGTDGMFVALLQRQ